MLFGKKNKKLYIYSLRDPDNNKVFYIGRTVDPETRLSSHIGETKRLFAYAKIDIDSKRLSGFVYKRLKSVAFKNNIPNVRKHLWIQNILKRGKQPTMLIEDVWDGWKDTQDANRLEDAWIAEMRRRKEPIQNYIYSRRQNPTWYSKEKGSATPMQYIKKLKRIGIT